MELVVIVPGKLHATIAALGDVMRDAGGGYASDTGRSIASLYARQIQYDLPGTLLP